MAIGLIVKSLATRVGGPILLYIAIAGLLGMGGTFVYVKYLKNKNLDLLKTVSEYAGALGASESENTRLRGELTQLDELLTKQRLSYGVIDKQTELRVGDINNEEDVNGYINRSEFGSLQQW